nr:MAG TPA: hypothetical protein [Caudoviricetes sp.]
MIIHYTKPSSRCLSLRMTLYPSSLYINKLAYHNTKSKKFYL